MGPQTTFIVIFVCFTSVLAGKYDLYKTASTWGEARDACERDGMRLVAVGDDVEHSRICHLMSWIDGHFWIGLRKVSSNYQWTDATVAQFTVWGNGQPSSQSECVRYSVNNYMWETHNCSAALPFMCENDVHSAKVSGKETMTTGLAIGFCAMFGLLLFGCLLLQLPCCRTYTDKVGRGKNQR